MTTGTRCKREQPLSEFYAPPSNFNRPIWFCKECERERVRERKRQAKEGRVC